MEPWSAEWKQAKLDQIHKKWKACQACELHRSRKQVVFGKGNPNAEIMFVGEGPGEKEDATGIPFCPEGNSGDLLTKFLDALGQDRDDFFIDNIVACRPPKNREPMASERNHCMERLYEVIYIVDPILIVPVGKFAMNALIGGRDWSIEREHGNIFSSPLPTARVTGEPNGIEIPGKFFPKNTNKMTYRLEYEATPIYHPAFILRMDSVKDGEFETGGLASQTVTDLDRIFSRLRDLKEEYEKVSRVLNRR